MFKYAVPIILIGLALAGFFIIVNPLYQDISNMQAQVVSYNEALDNSKALEAERDTLTQKYNSMDPNNLAKLQKLLPDNVDNIRLILEIEGVASPYGMTLKDVKYDTTTSATTPTTPAASAAAANSDYGTWNLGFSTPGTYSNFLDFVADLEKNLRIVDISSIDFSSDTGDTTSGTTGVSLSPSSDNYTYTFNIKTYWLKG